MSVTLLRVADYRRMPWKNGGGETVEIAVFPPDAGLSDFDWRISMAKVAGDGPFSIFPEIDRTLCVLQGNGIELSIDEHGTVRLDATSEPLFFPADVAVEARLIDGPITDLNVMTRRNRLVHSVQRLNIVDGTALRVSGKTVVVLCAHGAVGVDAMELAPLDCLLLDEAAAGKTMDFTGAGTVFIIEIHPSAPSRA
jgi:uncharacterized protein